MDKATENKIIERAEGDEKKVSVGRHKGTCSFCMAEDIDGIEAFDPEVYEGLACADCILSGLTGNDPDARLMRPMTIVAKAYKGIEPFKTMLIRADQQREKKAAGLNLAAMAGNVLPNLPRLGNRRDRARARALARKAKHPTRKKPKKKKRVRL